MPSPLTIQPCTDDTHARLSAPNNNYGNLTTVSQNVQTTGVVFRGFYKFDLSSIPAGVTITQAVFSVYGSLTSGPVDLACHKITSANWAEGTLTWNNQPNGSEITRINDIAAGGWLDFDITATCQAWYAGTLNNYGLMLNPENPHTSSATWTTLSSENASANKPKLVITYTTGGASCKINIGGSLKASSAIKINIGDVWKDVSAMKINIGDVWKDVT